MNKTALIVVDMQNAFLHPDGENFFPGATETIAPVQELIKAAQKSECLIVYTLDRHRMGLPDFEQKHLPVHGLEGDHNADYFEGFGPAADKHLEIEIVKRRYSAFFGTDLAMTLRECGVETTAICGVKTNVCVRATCQDAFAHGFKVVVPEPATASNRENLSVAALEDIDRYLGAVLSLDDALALIAKDGGV